MSERDLEAVSRLGAMLSSGPELLLVAVLAVSLLGIAVIVTLRVRPSVLVAISLCLMVFSGEWSYMHIPFGIDQVIAALAIAGAIYRAASPRHPECFVLRPLHLVLVLTVVYTVLSALWSGTLTDKTDLFAIIDAVGVLPYALFALAPVIFATPRDRQILLLGLFALGIYLGVVAFGELTHIRALVFPSYINNPDIGIHADRVRGPFLEASPEGFALFSAGFAALWIGLQAPRPRLRIVCGAVVLLCLLGIFGTVTRAVWLGCAVSAILSMVMAPRLRRYTVPGVLAVAVVILVALALVPGLSSLASSRTNSDRPVWDRLNSDRAALRMFESDPLLGEGFGTFATKGFGFYEESASYPLTFVSAVHNVYLGRFAELGLIGGGLWLVSLLLAIGYAMRGRRSGSFTVWRVFAAAIVVNWAINAGFVPLDYAMPNALLWTLLGISSLPLLAAEPSTQAAAVARDRPVPEAAAIGAV